MAITKEGPTSGTNDNGNEAKTEYENNQVNVNDGTLRITVRWRPTKYNKLLADNTLWNYKATDLVRFILGTATRAVIHRWKIAPAIPSIKLTPDHLLDNIGLQTLPTSPAKTFIFS